MTKAILSDSYIGKLDNIALKNVIFGSLIIKVILYPGTTNKIKEICNQWHMEFFSTYVNLTLKCGSNHVYTIDGGSGCLYCNCPELLFRDISVLVLLIRLKYEQASNNYEHIFNHDDGYWNKILGFRSGLTDKLNFVDSKIMEKLTFVMPTGKRLNSKILIS